MARAALAPTVLWLLVLLPLVLLALPLETGGWSLNHWLFTWEHGVSKRALPGEVLRRLGLGEVDRVAAISAATGAVAAAATALFLRRRLLGRAPTWPRWLFLVLATTHVATLQRILDRPGRTDHVNLLLALAALAATERLARGAALAVVVACCAVGALVHEAMLVVHAPLLLGWWLVRHGGPAPLARGAARAAALGALVGLAAWTYVVAEHGRVTSMDRTEYEARLRARHGERAGRGVRVLFARTDASAALRELSTREAARGHAVLLVALAPTAVVLGALARRLRRGPGPPRAWLLAASLSPLALYGFGEDFYRWWGLALTNVFLAAALLAGEPAGGAALEEATRARRVAAALAIALAFALGPLGSTEPFPDRNDARAAALLARVRGEG